MEEPVKLECWKPDDVFCWVKNGKSINCGTCQYSDLGAGAVVEVSTITYVTKSRSLGYSSVLDPRLFNVS